MASSLLADFIAVLEDYPTTKLAELISAITAQQTTRQAERACRTAAVTVLFERHPAVAEAFGASVRDGDNPATRFAAVVAAARTAS